MAKRKLNLNLNDASAGVDLKSSVVDSLKSMDKNKKNEEDSTEPRIYKRIQITKIQSSPLNDYPIDNIEELENLILSHGLLDPLCVNYHEEEDYYELESGDRRYHAIQNLIEKYEGAEDTSPEKILYDKNVHGMYLHGIYCMVENGPIDSDSVRARIIVHNESTRNFDAMRTASHIAELAQIYTRQNESLPKDQRHNVNEKIRQELMDKYTVRQIIRYKNFDDLVDELKQIVVEYNMSITEIATYHNLTEEEQLVLADYIKQNHVPGKKLELPSMEDIRASVQSVLEEVENEKENISDLADENSDNSFISDVQPGDIMSPAPEDTTDTEPKETLIKENLSDIKEKAAKKIKEVQSRKDGKITDALMSIQKKSSQLEKAILNYISDSDNMQLDIDKVISDLDETIVTLSSIKTTLEG